MKHIKIASYSTQGYQTEFYYTDNIHYIRKYSDGRIECRVSLIRARTFRTCENIKLSNIIEMLSEIYS